MVHITDVQLLVGVLAVLLLLGLLAAKAIIEARKERSAPFRNYFDAGYQRELIRHSDLSECEDWRAERESRFTPLRLRDSGFEEQRINVRSANRRDREAN